MRLRPHHVYCIHFFEFCFPERGPRFEDTVNDTQKLLQDSSEDIEFQEGPDSICEACLYYNGERCTSPQGDETTVKKWDSIILKELGVKPGQVLRVQQVDALIREKAPLNICMTACPYRGNLCNPHKIRGSSFNLKKPSKRNCHP
jgi:hypothetical protein